MKPEKCKLKLLIAEDNLLDSELLCRLLQKDYADSEQTVCRSGRELISELASGEWDLLFLDVELKQDSGIEIIRSLQGGAVPPVIMITSHNEFAVDAFDLDVVDYLVKPASFARLGRAMNRFFERRAAASKQLRDNLILQTKGLSLIIPNDEIIFIVSNGKKSIIHTEKEDFTVPLLMKEVESIVNPESFIRVHREYIVNLSMIRRVKSCSSGRRHLLLGDSRHTAVPVGQSYRENVERILVQDGGQPRLQRQR